MSFQGSGIKTWAMSGFLYPDLCRRCMDYHHGSFSLWEKTGAEYHHSTFMSSYLPRAIRVVSNKNELALLLAVLLHHVRVSSRCNAEDHHGEDHGAHQAHHQE